MISHRHRTMLIGLCLLFIIGFYGFVVQPAFALIGVVLLGVFLAGVVAGGVIGYYITTHYQKLSLAEEVGDALVNYTAKETENLLLGARQEYINEKELIASAVYYFMRKGEYGAQYFINETEFPYEKVMRKSGLHDDMESLFEGTMKHLEQLRLVIEGHAEYRFTGDMTGYTVNAIYTKAGGSLGQKAVSLKDVDMTEKYGVIETWNSTNNPTPFDWTEENSGFTWGDCYLKVSHSSEANKSIVTENSFHLPINVTLHFHLQTNSTSGTGAKYLYIQLLKASDNSVIWEDSESILTDTQKDIDFDTPTLTYNSTYKLRLMTNVDLGGGATSIYLSPLTITINTEGKIPNCRDVFYPIWVIDNEHKPAVIQFDYYSTGSSSSIRKVNPLALFYAIKEYCITMKTKIRAGMNAGQAYWNYLKGLGYTDVNDIPTTIPCPDLLMPPVNATFWGANIGYEEWYAILASYMQSLKALFEDAEIGRRIGNVTFADIQFVNLPVYFKGYLYFVNEPTENKSVYCSSIWLMPLTGNVTIKKETNTTLPVICDVVYKENSTGYIVYERLDTDDKIYAEHIYQRSEDGTTVTELSEVTLQTENLDKYATAYIPDYEGEGMEFTFDTQMLVSVLIPLMVVMAVMGMIEKTSRKSRSRTTRKKSSRRRRR